MPILLHADDFGITRSATQGILSAWVDGALDRFSIMANGRHLEWGCRILATIDRQPLRLAVHLNILEGQPLADARLCPALFGPNGAFPFSFLTLLRWQRQTANDRQDLSRQVHAEWRQQILSAQSRFPHVKIWSLDSHQHVHIIPWLWEIVLKLAREFSMAEIRIPRDHLFCYINSLPPRNWPSPQNFFKVRLINRLIRQNFYHRLYSPVFAGGLYYSGEMQRFPLLQLKDKLSQKTEEIELLYHPGDESPPSSEDRLAFPAFYGHENRRKELQALLDCVQEHSC